MNIIKGVIDRVSSNKQQENYAKSLRDVFVFKLIKSVRIASELYPVFPRASLRSSLAHCFKVYQATLVWRSLKYEGIHDAATTLEVVIEGHEETLFLNASVSSLMLRGKEIQERIQTVMEKVKTFHKRQHLTNTKQIVGCHEKRSHIHHAGNEREKANDQGDGDYSNEKFSNSGLFFVGHLCSVDPSNK